MRNISIICGLVVGCIVSGATGYMSSSTIKSAPAITFLWVHTFKLGVYPPAILPMLAVYGAPSLFLLHLKVFVLMVHVYSFARYGSYW